VDFCCQPAVPYVSLCLETPLDACGSTGPHCQECRICPLHRMHLGAIIAWARELSSKEQGVGDFVSSHIIIGMLLPTHWHAFFFWVQPEMLSGRCWYTGNLVLNCTG